MPRRVAQVHVDDHQIEDKALLRELEAWEVLGNRVRTLRDAYHDRDKEVKGTILALKGLPKDGRIRCGPYIIKVTDQKAREIKSRLKTKRSVKIERAARRPK